MKFKKSWIFWICYYGIAVIGNIVLICFCKNNLNITPFSLFPAIYILICAFGAWFFPSQFRYNYRFAFSPTRSRLKSNDFNARGLRIKFKKGEGLQVEQAPEEGYGCPEDRFASRIFLVCLPLFLPFFFFWSVSAKIVCGLLLLTSPVATLIYGIILEKKETNAHQAEIKKKLEEQMKKEELGKWR